MKSATQHQFSKVPQALIPRSSFDRSHTIKTTFDAGYLVPICVDEVLPGDTFSVNMTGFARLATPIKPIMDNMYMETFFFFVPNRLVWNNWQRMMGEQDNPADPVDYICPKVTLNPGSATSQTIYDYMGLPIYATGSCEYNVLPLRGYALIWNEWFRDQNLQDSIDFPKGDGYDSFGIYNLKKRGKRHDYFTSCLPFPQKGEDVTIPVLDAAPVVGTGVPTWAVGGGNASLRGNPTTDAVAWTLQPTGSAPANWANPNLQADLSSATATTINDLRVAFQFQKLLERDARGGTRYTEIIRAHFGVISPDARLQRPEFLGGGSSRINIRPVEQTSISGGETPQGNLAAYGTASLVNHGFTKSFTEHGYIIGLINVRADLTYQQGCRRMWLRDSKYDFYWPALAHIGEQAVRDFEIFSVTNIGVQAQPIGAITADGEIQPEAIDNVFGYQERWAEYRFGHNLITGKFRSDDPASLDIWHLAQDFDQLPLLNGDFIKEDPPVDRVIAVQEEPHFLFDGYFKARCARPMPLYGVPGNIDRF